MGNRSIFIITGLLLPKKCKIQHALDFESIFDCNHRWYQQIVTQASIRNSASLSAHREDVNGQFSWHGVFLLLEWTECQAAHLTFTIMPVIYLRPAGMLRCCNPLCTVEKYECEQLSASINDCQAWRPLATQSLLDLRKGRIIFWNYFLCIQAHFFTHEIDILQRRWIHARGKPLTGHDGTFMLNVSSDFLIQPSETHMMAKTTKSTTLWVWAGVNDSSRIQAGFHKSIIRLSDFHCGILTKSP